VRARSDLPGFTSFDDCERNFRFGPVLIGSGMPDWDKAGLEQSRFGTSGGAEQSERLVSRFAVRSRVFWQGARYRR